MTQRRTASKLSICSNDKAFVSIIPIIEWGTISGFKEGYFSLRQYTVCVLAVTFCGTFNIIKYHLMDVTRCAILYSFSV
jgi:hypothetical protein